jgi:hypothetical protein
MAGLLGCSLVLLAMLSAAGGHPFVAAAILLPGVLLIPLGVFFAFANAAEVTVSKERSGRICCLIAYQVFHTPYKRRRVYLRADDRLVVCHDTPIYALVILIAFLCLGVLPGVFWWIFLLSKRTNLEIRKATGKVERFSFFWGESGTQDLIDTIRQVEHLPIERA